MKTRYKLLLLIVFGIGIQSSSMASPTELARDIRKSYAVEPDMYLELNNQYGDIEIITWEKDSVLIEVKTTVRTEKDIHLEEIIDRIQINFRSNASYIVASTEWADEVNFFKKGFHNVKQGLGNSGNITVNYIVHIPSTMALEINNKFGNVYMGDYEGSLTMVINHGDLRARNLSNVKKIRLKYGKLKVQEMKGGSLELASVKSAYIVIAKDIMITSSSSEIEIDQVEVLNLSSKHDDIRIESAQKIYGSLSLSDLRVTTLKQESRLQSKFGSIYLKRIESEAKDITIDGVKTDIFINFSPSFHGKFNINIDEQKRFAYSTNLKVNSKELISETVWNFIGSYGSGNGTNVNITSERGFLQIGK